jgi:hypothetical protein
MDDQIVEEEDVPDFSLRETILTTDRPIVREYKKHKNHSLEIIQEIFKFPLFFGKAIGKCIWHARFNIHNYLDIINIELFRITNIIIEISLNVDGFLTCRSMLYFREELLTELNNSCAQIRNFLDISFCDNLQKTTVQN